MASVPTLTRRTLPREREDRVVSDAVGFAVIPTWLLRSRSVSPQAKVVFLHLSSRVSEEGVCWPSQVGIAEDSGLGERTVQRATAELRRLGLIDVTVERTPTGRRNRYRLMVDRFGQGGAASQAGPMPPHRREN